MASPVYGYDVDSESLLDQETTKVQPAVGQRGPSVSVSPSPFHVPVGVDIVVSGEDTCTMTFAYPNDERPDRSWHTLQGDPELEVQLGKYTKKLLALRFSSALKRLQAGPVRLTPEAAVSWCSSLPDSAQSVCRRNAVIVATILATMPDALRRDVVQQLKKLTREARHR